MRYLRLTCGFCRSIRKEVHYFRIFTPLISLLLMGASLLPRNSFAEGELAGNCDAKIQQLLISLTGEPTSFHALNTAEMMRSLKKRGKLELTISDFKEVPGLKKLCSQDLEMCFVMISKKGNRLQNNINFTLKGADGKWFEVPASRPLISFEHTPYVADFSKFKYVVSPKENFGKQMETVHELFEKEFFDEKNSLELADYLTARQLGNSTNFRNAVDESRKAFGMGILEANQTLSAKLLSHEPIDRETLSQINFLANQGVNPYEKAENAKLAGVLRGTSKENVNLSKFEVFQSEGHGVALNQFLPAAEVPGAIDYWMKRVNQVGPHTAPEEVFALYKELVDIHPFPDGNGRTSRMMLNYMLLKAKMVPVEFPAHSLYFRPEDILRKYTEAAQKELKGFVGKDYFHVRSLAQVTNMEEFAQRVKNDLHLEHVKIEHLHGTSGYIFVGTYKGRFIQFESTQFGEQLSDSLGAMVTRCMKAIDEQEILSKMKGIPTPTYAVYPELLEQKQNYHLLYEQNYLKKQFVKKNNRVPNLAELEQIIKESKDEYRQVLANADHAKTEREFYDRMMHTPRLHGQADNMQEVTDYVLSITAPEFKERIRKAMLDNASDAMKESFVQVFNAFNSPQFDQFMSDVTLEAMDLCRKAKVCGPNQRMGIPDAFLAKVLKNHAEKLGVKVETISRFVGREPGRLYIQRIQRGSLLIDDGAPGNHGMMPHGLQNLFIYQQLGKERGQAFFKDLKGWVYERAFDSNIAFTPIPSTRDITRRHYWTGVFKAGNRSEVSKIGELVGEEGHYPGFLRENKIELVSVEEKTKNLLNDGSVIKARYKGHEFSFEVDRDGVPLPSATEVVNSVKREVDEASTQ